MNGRAYYNEIDPTAVAVLRHLIGLGLIAPGDVDDRSIRDVQPEDLKGYAQCHFFAGAGLWSVAARMAGWPDDRPLWTGSCPCQPFSQAGKRRGTADERHLWPDLHRLIRACRPAVAVGEQVAGAAGYAWLDGVAADLDGEGYACEAFDIPAAAVDAPHIRQRLWWMAVVHAPRDGWREGRAEHGLRSGRPAAAIADAPGVTLGDAFKPGLEGQRGHGGHTGGRAQPPRSVAPADGGNVGDANSQPGQWRAAIIPRAKATVDSEGKFDGSCSDRYRNADESRSFWSDHDWLPCHAGKARRTQPGTRLLVDGMAGRIHLWRLAGNSIVPQVAAQFIGAVMDVLQIETEKE